MEMLGNEYHFIVLIIIFKMMYNISETILLKEELAYLFWPPLVFCII